jgi:hypothetical protein
VAEGPWLLAFLSVSPRPAPASRPMRSAWPAVASGWGGAGKGIHPRQALGRGLMTDAAQRGGLRERIRPPRGLASRRSAAPVGRAIGGDRLGGTHLQADRARIDGTGIIGATAIFGAATVLGATAIFGAAATLSATALAFDHADIAQCLFGDFLPARPHHRTRRLRRRQAARRGAVGQSLGMGAPDHQQGEGQQ